MSSFHVLEVGVTLEAEQRNHDGPVERILSH